MTETETLQAQVTRLEALVAGRIRQLELERDAAIGMVCALLNAPPGHAQELREQITTKVEALLAKVDAEPAMAGPRDAVH